MTGLRRRPAELFAAGVDDGSADDELVRLARRLRSAAPPVPLVPDADFRRSLRTTVTAMATHRRPVRHRATVGVAVVAAAVLAGAGVAVLDSQSTAIQLQAESLAARLPMSPLATGEARLRLASAKLRALRDTADAEAVATGLAGVDTSTKAAAKVLTAAALARGDRAPLDALDDFVVGQLAGLASLDQTVRVDRSRSLVLRLAQRSRDLRRSVACAYGYAAPAGSDDLGGRPPACAAGPT
ncbi:hypothetical protein [Fodinicola acaciae]|uniref:hypothetical protein n=1 Tax=Fodinicola acaciae TaxID=2681555 RepID=UPI0013D4E264|nr:hypothetical protein [Fodinicola acaciae]